MVTFTSTDYGSTEYPSPTSLVPREFKTNLLRNSLSIFFGSAVFLLFASFPVINVAKRSESDYWLLTAIALAWALPGLWVAVRAVKARGTVLEVREDGLVHASGGRQEQVRWNEIDSIYHSQYWDLERSLRPAACALEFKGRKLFIGKSIKDYQELIGLIEFKAVPAIAARCREQLNSGEPLVFGPIVLTSDSLKTGRKTLEKEELESIALLGSRASSNLRGGGTNLRLTVNWNGLINMFSRSFFSKPINQVPNVFVLVHLVGVIMGRTPKYGVELLLPSDAPMHKYQSRVVLGFRGLLGQGT